MSLQNLSMLYCLAAVLFLFYYVAPAFWSPLRSIPGPFLARFTRLWYLYAVWHGDFEKVNIALHIRYGPVVRIAPNEYSVDDPKAMKTIYGHGTKFIKAPWYFASGGPDPHAEGLFTDRNVKQHAQTRRRVAGLYSMSNLLVMESQVNSAASTLVQVFRNLSFQTPVVVDLQHWCQCFAFDAIGLITLNKPFGFLDEGKDQSGMIAGLERYLTYAAHVGIFSEFHPILFSIFRKTGQSGGSMLRNFTTAQVNQCRKEMKSNPEPAHGKDFLSQTLSLHAADPQAFPLSKVFDTCMTNIGAGSDTTSISLAGIFYNLLLSPTAMSKLQDEIDQAYSSSKLSSPPCFSETQALPYLQACIKEGLRLHPATGLPLARAVPPEGASIAGYHFPVGSVVGINSWVAHNNAAVFGSDPEVFRPERWMESEERSSTMGRYFLAFGAGSRTCIGKNISLLEISLVIPELLRNFSFRLAAPQKPLVTQNRWFVKQKNLQCIVSQRQVVE